MLFLLDVLATCKVYLKNLNTFTCYYVQTKVADLLWCLSRSQHMTMGQPVLARIYEIPKIWEGMATKAPNVR